MLQETERRAARERDTSAFRVGEMSSALVEINNETQLQPYTPSGQFIRTHIDNREPESSTEDSAESYTVVIEEHKNLPTQEHRHSPGPSFLDWVTFDEIKLPPRQTIRKSRLEKILSPLNSVKAELPGNVSVEGLGGLVESAHNIFHSAKRDDFMQSERILHLQKKARDDNLSRRELERFENELFDLTKYNGSCDYLTAVTWTEEGTSGSITLFEVLFDDKGDADRIRPVAAMQNVPNPVLVKMRTHERIQRKVVFVPIDEEAEGFKWKANPHKGPRYVKLHARSASPLRSTSRTPAESRHGKLADADGIRATIPQFVALMHGHRALLEDIKSSSIGHVKTADGDVLPAVTIIKPPRRSTHEGDSVHVAVLIPDEAAWADEEIIWTDPDGLVEFRRRKYWDLIEKERPRKTRSRSRSRSRDRGSDRHASHSRHASGHRPRSRSRSRHLGLDHLV
ncbi:hypothetical protein QBC35DRAFT_476362 [Podospora australis]|uniref:Uncharacterized protein n=1 Tax=Podospora australis TaxID=1536484 RepID=A0AAN6WNI6_9PEZI|nr:hypothetical protein QBC35DRAFT_476362 [Podospora australis]